MTLQQFEYILAVARYGHFGRAADACNVTQPTLSAMIGKLEEEVGAKLFDRNRQPIRPTPVGEKVILRAREVLEQAESIKGHYPGGAEVHARHISSGHPAYHRPLSASALLSSTDEKIPCTGHQGEGDEDARDKGRLLQGDIDAGILAAIDGLEEYAQISLFYERYVGYVSREDPLYARESIRTADVASSGQL